MKQGGGKQMALRVIRGLMKFDNFMADMGITYYQAIGILESLWHFTATNAIQGDVGRHSNQDIAKWIGYAGDADKLIDCLVKRNWLEPHSTHRLIVHDWHIHADKSVRTTLINRKLRFCETEKVTKTPEKNIGIQSDFSESLSGSGSGAVYGSGAGSGDAPPDRCENPFEKPQKPPVFVNPIARYAESVQEAARDAMNHWHHWAHGLLPNLHSESTHKDLNRLAAAEEAQPGTLIAKIKAFTRKPDAGFTRDAPLWKVLKALGFDSPNDSKPKLSLPKPVYKDYTAERLAKQTEVA